MDGVITSEMLGKVCELLHGVASRWRFLGLALGVKVEELDKIECNNRNDCEVCLCKMLHHRLTGVPDYSLTWSTLCECLKKPGVERYDVAMKVKEHVGPSIKGSKRKREINEEQQLICDIHDFDIKFDLLKDTTRNSLEAKNLTPQELTKYLLNYRNCRWSVIHEDTLLAHKETELKNASNIEEIFNSLSPFWSFLDYDFLEKIIFKFGDKTDKEVLYKYIEDLKDFLCTYKVDKECKLVHDGSLKSRVRIHLRLDTSYLSQYRNIKACIARIFKVKTEAITLEGFGNGSVSLTFLAPRVILSFIDHIDVSELPEVIPTILSMTVKDPAAIPPSEMVLYNLTPNEEKVAGSFFTSMSKALTKMASWMFEKRVSIKLLEACRSDNPDIDLIKGYLEPEKECDINIREQDEFKWTPLMWACEKRHTEVSKLLLQFKPQVNMQNKKEWSALHLASRAGDLEIVQEIVELGAEIDMPTNKKWTALMWSAQEGHAEIAEFLLRKGAFVDYPDQNGWTPLMQASQEGHVDVVIVLLKHKANVNYHIDKPTTWSALMAAAKNKHSEVVDALLKGGAEVDLTSDDGSTALHVASYYENNSEVLKKLLEHSANVNHQDKDGMTALMLAASKGYLDSVQALIEGGADINIERSRNGYTAIFFAAEGGHLNIFEELLNHNAKIETKAGRTVFNVASIDKRDNILHLMEKAGYNYEPFQTSEQVFLSKSGYLEEAMEAMKKFRAVVTDYLMTFIPAQSDEPDTPRGR